MSSAMVVFLFNQVLCVHCFLSSDTWAAISMYSYLPAICDCVFAPEMRNLHDEKETLIVLHSGILVLQCAHIIMVCLCIKYKYIYTHIAHATQCTCSWLLLTHLYVLACHQSYYCHHGMAKYLMEVMLPFMRTATSARMSTCILQSNDISESIRVRKHTQRQWPFTKWMAVWTASM